MSDKRVLLVIDMQNDFITGPLGNKQGQAIVKSIAQKIRQAQGEETLVLFTRDTHGENYMDTQEGRNLPVEHCIEGEIGWEIVPELKEYANSNNTINKHAFGAKELGDWIIQKLGCIPKEIEICGVCTDICIISNAMILKAAFPETHIRVLGNLCAGVTKESHRTALEAMKPCQIDVVE